MSMSDSPSRPDSDPPAEPPGPGPKKRLRRVLFGAIGGLVAFILIVVGADIYRSHTPDEPQPPDYGQWHPVGPANAWIDPGYATGQITTLELRGQSVKGRSQDGKTILAVDSAGVPTGIDTDGTKQWRLGNVLCAQPFRRHIALDGNAYCHRRIKGDRQGRHEIVRIAIATGHATVLARLPYVSAVQVVGRTPAGMVVTAKNTLMLLPGNGVITWKHDFDSSESPDSCHILGTHIGCEIRGADKRLIRAFDALNGKLTASQTKGLTDEVIWATDAFVTLSSPQRSGRKKATFYTLKGESLGPLAFSRPPKPDIQEEVFYPLNDLQQEPAPVLVDAEGAPVGAVTDAQGTPVGIADSDQEKAVFLPSGNRTALTTGYADFRASSPDGSALLFSPDGKKNGGIYSRQGKELHHLATQRGNLNLVDGLILTTEDDSPVTRVVLPTH